jgi:dTDP-4-dehydrorhamnose reductase
MVILVTGAAGQLGQAIQYVAPKYSSYKFLFASSTDLDITNLEDVNVFFVKNDIDVCVNAAAYTAVDKAETDIEVAKLINEIGPKNLAIVCKKHNAKLIHISTDFVFDGNKSNPYLEDDITNPINVYGKTKLAGEQEIINNTQEYYILRTSWVYSQFGNNFFKTMLRLSKEKEFLNIIADQVGTPTNAVDLANVILHISSKTTDISAYGIYNFSNEGSCSWFDFVNEIFRIYNISIPVNPIPTSQYPTPAQRPKYSVMDKSKIKETFEIHIKSWQESLQQIAKIQ